MRKREEETAKTICYLSESLKGHMEHPVLLLIPILNEIAFSLAVIADEMREKRKNEQD